MSIIAAIVDQHRGHIELKRSDLGGLAVKVTLPVA